MIQLNEGRDDEEWVDPTTSVLEVTTSTHVSSISRISRLDLRHLSVLKLGPVGLVSLEGVDLLPSLRELYCPFNLVAGLDPLWGNDTIEVLDMEGNQLSDPGNWMILDTLTNLRELEVSGNPIAGDQSQLGRWMKPTRNGGNAKHEVRPVSTASTSASEPVCSLTSGREMSAVIDRLRRPTTAATSTLGPTSSPTMSIRRPVSAISRTDPLGRPPTLPRVRLPLIKR